MERINRTISNVCGRILAPGERGVAGLGATLAATLVVSVAANAWLDGHAASRAAAESRLVQMRAVGPLMAETARRLVADADLAPLRRSVADAAQTLKARGCTVSLGENEILADAVPGRINTFAVPREWIGRLPPAPTAAADADSGATHLYFPFSVAGHGTGLVDLVPAPPPSATRADLATPSLICAAGLSLVILVYSRSRRRLMGMELVSNALAALHAGEASAAGLQVDERLGPIAAAWNRLVVEVEDLRRRSKTRSVTAPDGNRRSGGGNLEAAWDALSQGLLLVDDKLRVRFCNGAAATFLKRDRAALAGVAATDLVADPTFKEALIGTASGKLRRASTLELEQPADPAGGGSGGVLRFCVRPVRRGDVDSAMIIIEDITQQRTAERARNTFINQVTHELRTPLTNIRLYVETAIEDGEHNPEVRSNCLNVINQESRRLERIVSEMLSVAEIEAGSTMVHRDEVYVDALVKDLQADYQAQAADRRITLAFNVSPKLPKVYADKDKLAIAIHNLIGNALKYTPEGGTVTVGVDVRDGQLAVDVADTGIGIDPLETEKIFDRFFRSGDPRVGKIVGTGLGLTLAREVMRLHGGDISVQSVINRGSTFTATLPLNAAA